MGIVTSSFVGYLNYIVLLFLITGSYAFWVDVKNYKNANLKREKKAAKILAWVNCGFGIGIFIGSWIYKQFI